MKIESGSSGRIVIGTDALARGTDGHRRSGKQGRHEDAVRWQRTINGMNAPSNESGRITIAARNGAPDAVRIRTRTGIGETGDALHD